MIRFLVIEGNIGAGKTTLTHKLAADRNAKVVLEQFADNPFLPKFYKNPDKYAFPLEMSFLADRYNQLKSDLSMPDIFSNLVIADYYFNKSLIFAQNTLKDDEMLLYRQFYEMVYSRLPKPDLYVYLHNSIERLLFQIAKRGRGYEKSITAKYLQQIEEAYFTWFRQQKDFPVLVLDAEKLDFVGEKSDYQQIINAIFSHKYNVGLNRVMF
jgi:deoxyadenosine/deoxycytidine kinase